VTVFPGTPFARVRLSLAPPLPPRLPAHIIELARAGDALPHGAGALADGDAGAEEVAVVQAAPGRGERVTAVAEVAGPEPL